MLNLLLITNEHQVISRLLGDSGNGKNINCKYVNVTKVHVSCYLASICQESRTCLNQNYKLKYIHFQNLISLRKKEIICNLNWNTISVKISHWSFYKTADKKLKQKYSLAGWIENMAGSYGQFLYIYIYTVFWK